MKQRLSHRGVEIMKLTLEQESMQILSKAVDENGEYYGTVSELAASTDLHHMSLTAAIMSLVAKKRIEYIPGGLRIKGGTHAR